MLGLGLSLTTSGGLGFDPSALALFAAMEAAGAAPSDSYQSIINSTILALKANGNWDKLYRFYHFAAPLEDQAKICWKSLATLTKAGVVTHVANQGFTANGTIADAMQDTFNPTADSVGTDDFAVSLYSRTTTAGGSRYDWGSTNAQALLRIRTAGDVPNFRINNTVPISSLTTSTDTTGLWSFLRNQANIMQIASNGSQFGADVAVVSQAPPNFTINWFNAIIGTNTASQKQFAFGAMSKSRTLAQETTFYTDVVLPLLQWNGANV